MAEPKPLASLSAGLLARKGAARPAMRRQVALSHDSHGHDDLGWNDMGYDVDPAVEQAVLHPSGLSPMAGHLHPHHDDHAEPASVHMLPGMDVAPDMAGAPEPLVVQQRRRVQALQDLPPVAPKVSAAPARDVRPRAEAGAKGRFAFTLRLDAQRHLLLRLASAASNRSAQQILVALVDEYFADQPAVAAMAAQIGGTAAVQSNMMPSSGENA